LEGGVHTPELAPENLQHIEKLYNNFWIGVCSPKTRSPVRGGEYNKFPIQRRYPGACSWVLHYLPRLTDFNAKTENTAAISVNMTTHEPSFLQAPDYRPVPFVTDFGKGPFRNSSNYHVNIASIKRLADWFNFLKENNVYDNTRIILVSDHGPYENIATKTGLPFMIDSFNPILLVKDFNASGPMRTDDTFMSNGDVPSLALQGLFDDPRNPYTGNPVNMDAKQNPLYIFTSNPYGDEHLIFADETQVRLAPKKDYYVHDNIFDPANWEKAES
jgi:hypothetical protein